MRLRLIRVFSVLVVVLSLSASSFVSAAPKRETPVRAFAQEERITRDVPFVRVLKRLLKSWGAASQSDTMSTPRP